MENIVTFTSWALGESHKKSGKVWQDAVLSFEDKDKGHYYCAVSDGHGGDTYFRSDKGSRFLTEITIEAIKRFTKDVNPSLFDNSFEVRSSKVTLVNGLRSKGGDETIKLSEQDEVFRRLLSSIIAKWNTAIEEDWKNEKPTVEEMEKNKVPIDYIQKFINNENIELAYGCTLIAVARTPEYWFAFQLGDGKCVAFNEDASWYEPIADDELCQGSVTTSMCETNALDNFRYSYGNDNFPVAVFIGSDGMDDAYHNMNMLAKLYAGMIKSFVKEGYDATVKLIDETLPELSRTGQAQDDMSLAGIIDMDKTKILPPLFEQKEKEELSKKLVEAKELLADRQEKLAKMISDKQNETLTIQEIDKRIEDLKIAYKKEKDRLEKELLENENKKNEDKTLIEQKEKVIADNKYIDDDIKRIEIGIQKQKKEVEQTEVQLGIRKENDEPKLEDDKDIEVKDQQESENSSMIDSKNQDDTVSDIANSEEKGTSKVNKKNDESKKKSLLGFFFGK